MTMKNEILNVPPLRFPEFSSPWISERLGASCEIQMCKRIFAKQTATNGAVPFFKIGTVGGQPDAFISDPLFEEYSHKYHFPKKGEILITCAGTIGRCFQYDGSKAYYQDSNIVWISNPSQRITNDFLLLLLEAQNWKRLNATTIARLYNDDLLNCILFFPEDRIEQEKIASFLSAIDKRISVQMKIIEELQSLQKSSFCLRCHELKTRPYKLSELGSFISGGKFAKGDFSPQGLPAISYGDLFTSFTVYVDTPHHFVQANKATLMSSDHDLLFPSSTTVDASSLISPAALSVPGVALGSDIFVLRVRPEFSNVYLSLLINYVYKLPLSRLAQGSTITHLHYRDIQDFRLELPSLLDQKKAADSFLTFSKRVAVEKAILKNLISLRVFLLKGLFL